MNETCVAFLVLLGCVATTLAGSVGTYRATCHENGETYQDGERIPATDPCMTCHCYEGKPLCAQSLCLSPPMPHPGCKLKMREGVCCPTEYECPPEATLTPTEYTRLMTTTTTAPTPIIFEAFLGCMVDGRYYAEGEVVPDSRFCRECSCQHGNLTCQERRCPEAPQPNCEVVETLWNCCPTYKCRDAESLAETSTTSSTESHTTPITTEATEAVTETTERQFWRPSECVDRTGRQYSIGERMILSSDPCEICHCEENGSPLCAMASCAGPPSRYCMPIREEGTCCPDWDCSAEETTTSPPPSPATTTTPTTSIPVTRIDVDMINEWRDPSGDSYLEYIPYYEPLQLGCPLKGHLYDHGAKFQKGCDSCYCINGRIECVPVKCTPPKAGHDCTVINRGKPKSCCPQYRCKKPGGPRKPSDDDSSRSRLSSLFSYWQHRFQNLQGRRMY